MLDSLRAMLVFAHVAETKSFSRAAERLGVTKSAVSKQVAQLEAELGVQLLVRTTRKLVLSEVGERVYASCARIAGDVEAVREAAQVHSTVMAGQLRVTAPAALGRNYLMPLVAEFLAVHTQLAIELVLSDTFVDLVDDRIDLALRVGGRSDASLVTRKVTRVEFAIAASPGYIEQHGALRTPNDLAGHEWVLHSPNVTDPGRLSLRKGRRTVHVRRTGRLSCNDGPSGVAAACAGCGLVAVPDFELAPHIQNGSLLRVLSEWRIDDSALHLVFPPRKHVSSKVRTFADFVVQHWRKAPWQLASDPS